MTPLEINKKIAKAKGYTDIRQAIIVSPAITIGDGEYPTNWFVDSTDTLELFLELPTGTVLEKFEDYFEIELPPNTHAGLFFQGKTFGEATCLAWLAWNDG